MALDSELELEVATPKGMALRAICVSASTPSVNGEFTVLPGHLPLLASLKCGLLKYVSDGKEQVAAVGPGFVEVEPNRVQLLTDLFAVPSDIDPEATRKEHADAEEALKKFDKGDTDPGYQELQRNIEWAQAKLDARSIADR